MNSNIKDEELDNIAGGSDPVPEEFDWKTKEFETPKKPDPEGSKWHFEAIGDLDGHYRKITGGTSLPDIEIYIEKLNVIIDALKQATDHTNQAIMNMIIDSLKEYGKKPAIALAEKLFANDETKKKEIIDIINSNF